MPTTVQRRDDGATEAARRVAIATAVFSVVHTILASHRAKRLAERVVGERAARGGYRLAYNGVAIGMTLGLTAYVLRRRGPMVYALHGPAAALVRTGQLAALGIALRAAIDAGFADLSGFGPAWRWIAGAPLSPAPDGQGPSERRPGEPTPHGTFARTRNPLNFYVVPVLWLAPRASAGRIGLNAAFTAYCVLGSWHANQMLAARHGAGWGEYEAAVPLFVPRGRVRHGAVDAAVLVKRC
ncbi:hypothetical protein tb265_13630 [Gemmatimonadetes bacterium T265]|nr:hypothetical protein tb265_13630 [Gemmatimonadetes bacterium T265]